MFSESKKPHIYFLILGLCLFFGCTQPESNLTRKKSSAPDFTESIFLPKNTSSFHLSQVNAVKPVLIVFWATWCPSCREELPRLNRLASDYHEKIAIVSINAQEEGAEVERFLIENHFSFPVLLDPDSKLANLFEVTAIPSVLLLAKGGEILYYGFQLPSKEKLEAALDG